MPKLDFWYEFASPYACLAAMRIEGVAEAKGVEVIWHPFLLGAIYKMMDLPAPPMQMTKQKFNYMWLDSARQAKLDGFALRRPSQFPRIAVLPSRVALIGRGEGWCPEFSRRVFQANYADDQDIAKEEVIRRILKDMGQDADGVLTAALSPENKEALKVETQEAFDKDIFGVPTFFAGDEIFWGNDRLEQALDAALL